MSAGTSGGRGRQHVAQAVEHLLLPLAHALGVEPEEPALLGRVGGLLSGGEQPLAHGVRVLGGRLRRQDAIDLAQLVEDLDARGRALARPKPPSGFFRSRASATASRAIACASSPRSPASAAVTVFSVAAVSLTASIGPPGSASEIAMPATNGARLRRVHSSSVKSAFVVI
jgi:hypothetical protein